MTTRRYDFGMLAVALAALVAVVVLTVLGLTVPDVLEWALVAALGAYGGLALPTGGARPSESISPAQTVPAQTAVTPPQGSAGMQVHGL